MRMTGTTSERQFHNARRNITNERSMPRRYLPLLGVCLLAPAAFAQTTGEAAAAGHQLGSHHFGLRHGHRFGGLRLRPSEGFGPRLRKAWRAIPAQPA